MLFFQINSKWNMKYTESRKWLSLEIYCLILFFDKLNTLWLISGRYCCLRIVPNNRKDWRFCDSEILFHWLGRRENQSHATSCVRHTLWSCERALSCISLWWCWPTLFWMAVCVCVCWHSSVCCCSLTMSISIQQNWMRWRRKSSEKRSKTLLELHCTFCERKLNDEEIDVAFVLVWRRISNDR
jgi:hypothetical protein